MIWLLENANTIPFEKLKELIRIVTEIREEALSEYTVEQDSNPYLHDIRELLEGVAEKYMKSV